MDIIYEKIYFKHNLKVKKIRNIKKGFYNFNEVFNNRNDGVVYVTYLLVDISADDFEDNVDVRCNDNNRNRCLFINILYKKKTLYNDAYFIVDQHINKVFLIVLKIINY